MENAKWNMENGKRRMENSRGGDGIDISGSQSVIVLIKIQLRQQTQGQWQSICIVPTYLLFAGANFPLLGNSWQQAG